jgi:hypothetical protein
MQDMEDMYKGAHKKMAEEESAKKRYTSRIISSMYRMSCRRLSQDGLG